jgi:hypothetical protein
MGYQRDATEAGAPAISLRPRRSLSHPHVTTAHVCNAGTPVQRGPTRLQTSVTYYTPTHAQFNVVTRSERRAVPGLIVTAASWPLVHRRRIE